jgi:hypothetical protein
MIDWDWIRLAECMKNWRAFVKTLMNLRVSQNAGILLLSEEI